MLVIGIAGGTGSGKTTIALSIMNRLGATNATLLSQDNYYIERTDLSREERNHINYDHPDAMDHRLLIEHIELLRQNVTVHVPIYDFSIHGHSGRTITVLPKQVLLIEGIHVLTDEALRSKLDIKVFVDTDADVRVLRRLMRDLNERGRSVESVFHQYLTTVKPMHDAFIEPAKKYADIIIPEGGENQIGISMLTNHIESYMLSRSKKGPS